MKVRDSGMPEEAYWETLFDIPQILDRPQIDSSLCEVAEVGCGYGTFTFPVARCIGGTLHAFDIESNMVERTRRRASEAGVTNVAINERDVIAEGFASKHGGFDAVLLFNILHTDNPEGMLRAAAELLRPDGWVLAIHWRSDVPRRAYPICRFDRSRSKLPRGRKTRTSCAPEPAVVLPPWHFEIRLQRNTLKHRCPSVC